MLRAVSEQSDEVQSDFVEQLSKIAEGVRSLLVDNGFVQRSVYSPSSFWPAQRGKAYAFVDGGVASIDLPSAAPIGIRVGSYVVRPGERDLEKRERFTVELSLIDDLFSPSGQTYDDAFDDLPKLRDAARIISELAVGLSLSRNTGGDGIDAVLLHGPLVNPVSPYGLAKFPSFGASAAATLIGDSDWKGSSHDRQFVALYLEVLKRTQASGTPVIGVVERSVGQFPVLLHRVLESLVQAGTLPKIKMDRLLTQLQSYGFNDSSLLDVVLAEGEYIRPIPICRQGPRNKWPNDWADEIDTYPKSLTTYLKPSPSVLPVRVEAFEGNSKMTDLIELVLHTSRLLPSYGFPVGLDIVDRFAKVPAWMTRSIKGQHQVVLLRRAIESGDLRAIEFAKRVLSAKRRDWFFRPSA